MGLLLLDWKRDWGGVDGGGQWGRQDEQDEQDAESLRTERRNPNIIL